jgi:hypothetical protein
VQKLRRVTLFMAEACGGWKETTKRRGITIDRPE